MRYINIPVVTFKTIGGISVQVRDRRPISVFDTAFSIPLLDKDDLDEVASRPDVFGDEGEALAYAIVDNNAVKFIEGGFERSKIRSVDIPVVDE